MLLKDFFHWTNNKKNFIVTAFSSSLFFSLLLVLPMFQKVLNYTPGIHDFSEHSMSWATASNIDIGSRVNSYYLLLLGVALFTTVLFLIICRLFDESILHSTLLRDLSLMGIAGVAASILSATLALPLYIVGGAVFLSWAFNVKKNGQHKKPLEFSLILWAMLMAMPVSLVIWVISRRLDIVNYLQNMEFLQELQMQSDILFFIFVWFLISIGLTFLYQVAERFVVTSNNNISADELKSVLFISGIPVAATGIVQSILLELFNILNKRFDLVFGKPNLAYILLFVLSLLAMAFIFFIAITRKSFGYSAEKLVLRLYLPLILVTFSLIIAQPSRMETVGSEFFEMANHGLSVDHLFRYGSIPLIETFDAHMLSNQIFAYIYSLLNGYEPWAAFLYNPYIEVVYTLVLFFIFRLLIGEINSFFFILTFPLLGSLVNTTFLLSGILALSVIKFFISESQIKNIILFWISAAALCIYRLDLGVAAVFSGIVVFIYIALFYKRYSSIVKLFLVGMFEGVIAVALFVVMCLFKGINPIDRLVELIKLCQSNQNWAYASVGDSTTFAYTISYFLLPLLIISLLVFATVRLLIKRNGLLQLDQQQPLLLFLYFASFFLVNISRGIVRHSLAEGNLIYILSTFSLAALAFVVWIGNNYGKVGKFLIVSVITLIFTNINYSSLHGNQSLASRAFGSANYLQQYADATPFNGTRVQGASPAEVVQLKTILDATLEEDQTYFDFTSTNYYYALVGRKNPVYVNQSPLMISDDTTQKYALAELESEEPPIVLMPIEGKQWSYIDNIAVDFKYYMLSEYIYENYVPLIRMNNFDIYCKKNDRAKFVNKLTSLGLVEHSIFAGNINELVKSALIAHNVDLQSNSNGQWGIKSTGEDPYLAWNNKDNLIDLTDTSPEYSQPTTIKFEYISGGTGKLQVFYTLDENEEFSEQNSKSFQLSAGQSGEIQLDLPTFPYKMRLDIDSQEISIKKMSITQGPKLIIGQDEVWTRSIGYIPELWGEKDKHSEYSEAPNLPSPIINSTEVAVNVNNIKKDQPIIFVIEMQSTGNINGAVEMLSATKAKLGEYLFNVLPGTHTYAIRLSTDYKWWNNQIQFLSLKTSSAVTINKLSIFSIKDQKYIEVHQSK